MWLLIPDIRVEYWRSLLQYARFARTTSCSVFFTPIWSINMIDTMLLCACFACTIPLHVMAKFILWRCSGVGKLNRILEPWHQWHRYGTQLLGHTLELRYNMIQEMVNRYATIGISQMHFNVSDKNRCNILKYPNVLQPLWRKYSIPQWLCKWFSFCHVLFWFGSSRFTHILLSYFIVPGQWSSKGA